MIFISLLFVISVLWQNVDSADSCRTPSGQSSQCISLYECQPLLSAFDQRPLSNNIVNYLRESQCGFEGHIPRVCCGPLPAFQPTSASTPATTQRPVTPNPPQTNTNVEENSSEDSAPAPRRECGLDKNGDRIYGGIVTELDEFPWMALLGYRPRNKKSPLTYQCGGVLINKRYVLTAAHCVIGAVEKEVGTLESIRLGEYDLQTSEDCIHGDCSAPVQEIPVLSSHPHSGYSDKNKNRQDDIALIRMARRASYNYYVQPICLADNNLRLAPQTDVFVAGWGQTLGGRPSNVKLKLGVPIFNKDECSKKYKTLGAEIIEKQICAGGAFAQDTCRGDSGGPLMRRTPDGVWFSVAVVSFGYGCGRDGWPGVYTSVAGYSDWIQSTLRSTNELKRTNTSVEASSSEDSAPAPRSECGIDTNGDRIYGGVATDLDEFPWMALLGYRPRRKNSSMLYQCGGVLINKRYVLTAAHCISRAVEKKAGILESVRLGEYDVRTSKDCIHDDCAAPVQEIPVLSSHIHPGYSDENKITNKLADIGLIRMARRASYNYYVQPICLADNNLQLAPQTDVVVAGWGETFKGPASNVKLKLGLQIFNKEECSKKYKTRRIVLNDKHICAGGVLAQDTCRGDSGGPLMRRSPDGVWFSVGVISFGHGCGLKDWPGVYTSVASYSDWIQSTLRATNN